MASRGGTSDSRVRPGKYQSVNCVFLILTRQIKHGRHGFLYVAELFWFLQKTLKLFNLIYLSCPKHDNIDLKSLVYKC